MSNEETVMSSQICALALAPSPALVPQYSMLQIMAVQERACSGGRWLT